MLVNSPDEPPPELRTNFERRTKDKSVQQKCPPLSTAAVCLLVQAYDFLVYFVRLDGSTQRGFCFMALYELKAKQVTLLAMQQVKGTAAAGGEDPAWGMPISRLTFLCRPWDSRGLLSMKPTSRSVTHGTKAAVAYVRSSSA